MTNILQLKETAPCTADPESFFLDTRYGDHKFAKKVCNTCPFKQECLDHALKYDYFGVWGGTVQSERRAMQREMGIKPIGMWQLITSVLATANRAQQVHDEMRDYEQYLEDNYNAEGYWGLDDGLDNYY